MAGRLPIQISLVALSSAFSVGLAYGQAAPATAGQATAGNLAPVEVNRRREDTRAKLEHIMREVDGPKITVTKKTSVSVTDQQPELTQLSGRNLFIRTPGLIAADLPAGSPTELSYRGFSPTQGAGYVAVLQDGLPISNDAAAASIVSFSPLSQGLAQVQLIRGGAGLIYGPTPVGAVNLVSRRPHPGEPPNVGTEQVGGSNGLYSTYNFIEGAEGTIEYRASLGYQAVDGRQVNSASRLGAADSFLGWRPVKGELFYLDLHAYQAQAGDPGMADAPHDHHWTRRMSATLGAEVDAADGWRFEGKLWANYLETTARAAALSLAVFDDQTYRTLGVDMRLRHSFGRGNAFTMGLTADQDTSPRRQWLAANLEAAGTDRTGAVLDLSQNRQASYQALFTETVFRLPHQFHVTPSVRLEHNAIKVDPSGVVAALGAARASRYTPLAGLGIGNDFGRANETYVSATQGYRPVQFADLAAPSLVRPQNASLDPARSLSWEAGVHGTPLKGFFYDASLFLIDFRHRVESLPSPSDPLMLINLTTGDTRHQGFEGEVSYDLLHSASGGRHLVGFASLALTEARFVHSAIVGQVGRTPAGAPHVVAKSGLTWRQDRQYSLSLTVQYVGASYLLDSHQAATLNGVAYPAQMAAHTVGDLTGEYWLSPRLKLLAGAYNVADSRYLARASLLGGLQPAPGRTLYAGLALGF